MGVTYSAMMAVGIVIDPEEFFYETKKVEKIAVACSHPEAERHDFCPRCGAERKSRLTVEEVKVIKPEFREALPESEEDDEAPVIDWDEVSVKGLSVVCVAFNPHGESTYIFGAEIGTAGGYGAKVVGEDSEHTLKTIERVMDGLTALGIIEAPQTFLALSAS